jgi:hypothetical protein
MFIDRYCLTAVDDSSFPAHCSENDLDNLARYASIAHHTELETTVTKVALERVEGTASHSSLSPIQALNFAEKYNLRGLQAKMYYRLLCDAAREESDDTTTCIFSISTFQAKLPKILTELQKARIFQGYFSLIVAGDRILKTFSTINALGSRQYSGGEVYNIGQERKVAVDVIGRIQQMINARELSNAIPDLQNMLKVVKEELPIYFLGEV